MKNFTADFETCTWLEDETYVWAWALCEIGNEDNIQIGTDINSFFELCRQYNNPKIFFHNLKFDGSFLINYLLDNGYKLIKEKEEIAEKTFQCIISDLGAFYQIIVYEKYYKSKIRKITFIDSLKIINMSVKDIAKTFNLPISKLEIDYNLFRERDHQLTDIEKDYIKNDVKIVALALNELFKEKLTKTTAAANALGYYKQITGRQKFEHYFPTLTFEEDSLIRPAYKGGFTYLNPIYKDKTVYKTYVLDVNSLYPSVMRYEVMPYGKPVYFEGQYKDNKLYPLYIQTLKCKFKTKKNKIPTIQIKEKNLFFASNEYIEDSGDKAFMLTLTNIDLELFFDHYDVEDLEYIDGFMFRAIEGLFNEYIDYWTEQKIKAGKEGNKGKRQIAKLQLNSLYGKFAKSTYTKSKYPFIGPDGLIHYTMSEAKQEDGIYVPVAAFITSYARRKTIQTSQAIKEYSIKNYGKDMYIYSDTDSIHTTLPIEECKKFCQIDDFLLGYWAHEATTRREKCIRQKCYVQEFYNEKKYKGKLKKTINKCYHKITGIKLPYKMNITCAGLPERCYDQVTWDNFKEGFTAHGKLTYKYVKGGVKLVETDFTIKEG